MEQIWYCLIDIVTFNCTHHEPFFPEFGLEALPLVLKSQEEWMEGMRANASSYLILSLFPARKQAADQVGTRGNPEDEMLIRRKKTMAVVVRAGARVVSRVESTPLPASDLQTEREAVRKLTPVLKAEVVD